MQVYPEVQADNVSPLFRSVGRPKHIRVMAGALEGDLFIGPKAEVLFYSIPLEMTPGSLCMLP